MLLKIFLSGDLAMGPEPSEDALDLHLRQLPAGVDVEWIAVPYAIADPSCGTAVTARLVNGTLLVAPEAGA
ncbi:MAG: hypothetical protein QOC92_4006 [Acidimicrobiaceae bacterium]